MLIMIDWAFGNMFLLLFQVAFALSLSSEMICQYREHGNGNWIPHMTRTESALPGEGRGRTHKGCVDFGQVDQLNNENMLKNTNCVLCLAPYALHSGMLFQTSKVIWVSELAIRIPGFKDFQPLIYKKLVRVERSFWHLPKEIWGWVYYQWIKSHPYTP